MTFFFFVHPKLNSLLLFSPLGAIVGIVVGLLVLLAAVIVAGFFLIRQRSRTKERSILLEMV